MKELIFKLGQSVTVERVIETDEAVITFSEEAANKVITFISNMCTDKQYWYTMSKMVPILTDAANAKDEPR